MAENTCGRVTFSETLQDAIAVKLFHCILRE